MAEVKKAQFNIEDMSKNYVHDGSDNVLPGLGQMCRKVKAQKKISVSDQEIKETVEMMYIVIRYFNSLDEYASLIFGGTDIKEVKVPKEFADFIVPSAIRFDPTDLRSRNLAIKESMEVVPCTYIDYINLCDKFRSYFKKDASSDMIPLFDLKKSVTLTSIIDKASNKLDGVFKVNYGTQIYYPIRIEDITILYESRHFNAAESDLMGDYLANFRF